MWRFLSLRAFWEYCGESENVGLFVLEESLYQQSINRRLVFVAQFLLLLIRGRNSPSSSSSSVPPVLHTYVLILNIIPPSPFSPHCGGEEYVPISVRESIQSITPLDSNQQRENSNHINHNNRLWSKAGNLSKIGNGMELLRWYSSARIFFQCLWEWWVDTKTQVCNSIWNSCQGEKDSSRLFWSPDICSFIPHH